MPRARFFAIAPLLLASLLPLGGCASTADDESTTEDDLSYAALRIHAEGSPEAKAILRAANEMVAADLGFCTTTCEMDRGFFDAVETQKLLAFRAKGKPFTTLTQVIRTMAKPGVNNSQYVQGRFLDVAILRGWYEPFDAQSLFALREGSPEAVGIVRAANEIALDKLGRGKSGTDFVMLDWMVADAVAAVRKGADGTSGTADDGHFSTLADVRAAIFSLEVQRHAAPRTQRSSDMFQGSSLAQLLRMARLRKWLGAVTPPPPPPVVTDPFDPASCQGAGLTVAAAQTKFGPGQTTAALGEVAMNIRSRDCNPISGCTPWQAATTAPFTISSSYRRLTKSLTGFPEKGKGSLVISSNKVYFTFQTNGGLYEPLYSTRYSFHLTGCELGTGRWCQFINTEAGAQNEQWGVGYTQSPYSPAGFDMPTDLSNTITDHCARLVMNNKVQEGQTGTEYQLVVSGKY